MTGKKLHALRHKLGLTPGEMAYLLGVTQRHIYQWEMMHEISAIPLLNVVARLSDDKKDEVNKLLGRILR